MLHDVNITLATHIADMIT